MSRLRSLHVYDSVVRQQVRRSGTLPQVLQPLASRATRTAKQVASERTERHTGRYEGGFRSRVERASAPAVARIVTENTAPYADIIEEGSRPHIIRPRRAGGVLRFKVRGGVVFARRAFHPGTKPRHVIATALRRVARGG